MHNIIKRIFRRENIIAILLFLGALLGLMGAPQSIGITPDQITLALLALLGVDMLVEKLGYLDRIETHIRDLFSRIEPQSSVDCLLHPRSELTSFSTWLQQASDIWVSGMALNALIRNHGAEILEEAKGGGTRFRFLLVDPDKPSIVDALTSASSLHTTAAESEQNVRQTIAWLRNLSMETPKWAIEVRLTDHVPTCALLLVDGEKPHGQIVVETYGYRLSPGERLHMRLARSLDSRTYGFYFEQFMRKWEASKPLEIDLD